jgi:plastocyanin
MSQQSTRAKPAFAQQHARRVWRTWRVVAAVASAAATVSLVACGDGTTGGTTSPPVVTVSTVAVSASTTTLSPPATLQLIAVARVANGSVVASPSLSWTSSASNIATVNSSGVVTAIAPGAVTITAASGSAAGQVSLTVVAAGGTVTVVTVSLADATIEIGGLTQASLVARDASNAVIALGTRPVAWTSTNSSIATVSSGGVVTAIGVGATQLRATVTEGTNQVASSATLRVIAIAGAPLSADVSMPGLTFSPADIIVKVNGSVRFIFPAEPHNVFWRPTVPGAPTDINTTNSRTVSLTFPTSGVYPFVCTLHNGMSGTVVVSP